MTGKQRIVQFYLSNFTKAGIPPLLNMAKRPCRWCDKLCKVPTAPLVVSRSLLFDIARTNAATIYINSFVQYYSQDNKFERCSRPEFSVT